MTTSGERLSVREHMVLGIEARRWSPRRIGAKDEAIRHELGMSPVQHAQVLNALIDRPAALAASPLLVRRLQRLRSARRRERSAIPLATNRPDRTA